MYKYIQYVCSCQKYVVFLSHFLRSDNCPSFINVCHSYGTLRIARYYMLHTHAGTDGLVSYGKLDSLQSNPLVTDVPEVDIGSCSLFYPTTIVDGDMTTDQTAVFQEHVPLRTFSSFEELERLLISFQQVLLLPKFHHFRLPDVCWSSVTLYVTPTVRPNMKPWCTSPSLMLVVIMETAGVSL